MILSVPALVAVIANGMMAGLFFAFACAITPGFRRVDDDAYVRAFRAINSAILGGWFLLLFWMAPLSAAANVMLLLWRGESASLSLLGAICSILTVGITAAANVPLNRELDRAPITLRQQSRSTRRRFEERWNHWNLARTCTSIGALIFLTASLALQGG